MGWWYPAPALTARSGPAGAKAAQVLSLIGPSGAACQVAVAHRVFVRRPFGCLMDRGRAARAEPPRAVLGNAPGSYARSRAGTRASVPCLPGAIGEQPLGRRVASRASGHGPLSTWARVRRVATVVSAGAFIAACATRAGGQAALMAVDGLVVPVSQRTTSPHIVGRTLNGSPFDVTQWRGQVVVVNFWGSWCAPCRKEAPGLRRVAQETYAAGVRFVGIDVRDSRDSAIGFERSFGISYPSLFDEASSQGLTFGHLAPQATPSTFVLDRDGKVAARFIGATTYEPLLGTVEQVLAQG